MPICSIIILVYINQTKIIGYMFCFLHCQSALRNLWMQVLIRGGKDNECIYRFKTSAKPHINGSGELCINSFRCLFFPVDPLNPLNP